MTEIISSDAILRTEFVIRVPGEQGYKITSSQHIITVLSADMNLIKNTQSQYTKIV